MEQREKAQEKFDLGHKYFFEEPRDVVAAAREFENVTELAPDWNEGYGWLAVALQELGQTEGAISALREAIRLAPEDARHPITLGCIFLGKEDFSEAARYFRMGIALKPHYGKADAHLFLALALFGEGQVQEACEECRRVLAIEPMYPGYEIPHEEARTLLAQYESF